MRKLIKHDRYLESLCEQIQPRYDVLLKNVPLYSRRSRLVGEIDILAMKGNVYDIYEVKCSYRIAKARKQLHRIKRILSPDSRVGGLYFFCGASGNIESI